uniref:Uncharacterized protein n=1 Tax=Rhizophora mucronata TaxID=61149 RepID=A0A2P2JRR5_RHIMU
MQTKMEESRGKRRRKVIKKKTTKSNNCVQIQQRPGQI